LTTLKQGGARKGAGRKKEDRDRIKLQIVIDRELLNTIDEYLNDECVNRNIMTSQDQKRDRFGSIHVKVRSNQVNFRQEDTFRYLPIYFLSFF
jgi:hypothetical protein